MVARLAVAAFSFAIPMVLARVLIPAGYGTFKQAWLLSNTLFFVLPFGLTPSLVYFVPREPEKKRHFIAHVLGLTTLLGLVAGVALYLLAPVIANGFHNEELGRHMPIVAAFTFFRLAGTCLDAVYMSEGRIKPAALVRVSSEAFQSICLIAGALAFRSVGGVFAGIALASGLRAIAAWVLLVREHGFDVSAEDLRRQLAYALPFGAAFAIIIPQQQFHSYLISASTSAAVFAVYSVGCFQLPIVDMLYTPVSEILQLGIAEHDRDGDKAGAVQLFREAVSRLSFVFIPTMALLFITGPTLIAFLFTDRYLAAVPIFRLALLSIPMAAMPLDGVMRARAQNKFVLRVSALKLALTVPLVFLGLHQFGPIGALGGWMVAEEACRMLLLFRTSQLFEVGILRTLPSRELLFQGIAALAAVPVGLAVLHFAAGPKLLTLFACGAAFGMTYLATLRATGRLPPVRQWIPTRSAAAGI